MSTKSTIVQLRRGTLAELKELNLRGYVNENEIMNVTDTNELYIGKAGKYEKITKGGVLWSIDKDYLKGDIVVFQENPNETMVVYYAAQNNTGELPHDSSSGNIMNNRSNWLTVYPEATNITWHSDIIYSAGDIVEHDNNIYIAPIGTTSGSIPAGAMPPSSSWVLVSPPEAGGVQYKDITDYGIGDSITLNGLTYIAIRSNGPSFGVVDPSDRNNLVTRQTWKLDNGIAIWNAANTPYPAGSIVYDPADGGNWVLPGGSTDDTLSPSGGTVWIQNIGISTERGGIAYDATTTYVDDDVISDNGIIYIAIGGGGIGTAPVAGGNTSWKDTTVAGAYLSGWDPTGADEYPNAVADGAVTNDYYVVEGLGTGVGFTFTKPPLNGTEVFDGDELICGIGFDNEGSIQGSWSCVPSPRIEPERGGVAYSVTAVYTIGDVVTNGGILYRMTASVEATPGTFLASEWENIDNDAVTTVADLATLLSITTAWKQGDVVQLVDSGATYKKIASSIGATVINDWMALGAPEVGGVEYSSTVIYNEGDIVSDVSITPIKVYISLQNSNLNNALILPTWWQELDAMFYTATGPNSGDINGDGVVDSPNQHCPWDSTFGDPAGTHVTPNTLGEYPDTNAGDIIGATWYISGLGYDGSGDPIPYTMTTGSLTGADVREGDAIYWMSGFSGTAHAGTENWRLAQRPLIASERGGLLWRSGTTYAIDDTVIGTDNVLFRSITGGINKALPASGVEENADWSSNTQFDPGTY